MAEPAHVPKLFSDANGVTWCVRELQPADYSRALYFENDDAFRRVTHYPEDWRDLPTGELEILSHGT